eukprot:g3619.t1
MEGAGMSRHELSISSHRSSPPNSTSSIFAAIPPKASGQSVLADRYNIGQELGRSANGIVFKAFDKEENKFVAVKRIPLTFISREKLNGVVGAINLLKNLDHTNIVQYYDSVKTMNHLYIVLEYMESGSLASLIKPTNCGVFSEQSAALIVAQILQGLKYLHTQGVVHGDIKGANILTTKDMEIKLADFGVAARLFDSGSDGNKHDYYNTIAGSPYWIAPEIVSLESVTTAADIWSIGCLIIELLTGSPPYFECQPYQALYRIVQDHHPPLPDMASEALNSFLLCCFKKEPTLRPTAEELLKHDWITSSKLDRSSSPLEGTNNGSQETTNNSGNITAVLERILKHGHKSRARKHPVPSESDKVPSSEISGSPSNSGVRESTGLESEVDREFRLVPGSVKTPHEKRPYDVIPIPQLAPLVIEKDQSRTASASNSDASGLVVPGRRKDWREEGTSNQDASGTSSPDTRLPQLRREETELSVIFSDKVAEFDNALNKETGNDTWSHGIEVLSPNSGSRSSRSRILGISQEQNNVTNCESVLHLLYPHMKQAVIKSALQNLVSLIKEDVEVKNYFIKEDALLTLLELLLLTTESSVIEQILILANLICGDNVLLLRDASTLGLAAEIVKYAHPKFTLTIRSEAAKFIQSMCFTSIKSMDHLIKFQGLKWVVMLLEDGECKKFELKEIAVQCMLHIIEAQGTGMETRILRMFCMADLPQKLISSLASIHKIFEELSNPRLAFIEDTGFQDSFIKKSNSNSNLSEANSSSSNTSNNESNQTQQAVETTVDQSSTDDSLMDYEMNQSPVQILSGKMIDLLSHICASQAEVHRHMCIAGVLESFQKLLKLPRLDLVHRVVICLKYLSSRPTVIEYLQDTGTVYRLIPLLGLTEQSELITKIQFESLLVIDNVCKCAPSWRDKAVKNGIVPYLCTLCQSVSDSATQKEDGELDVRRFAVPLLCRLLYVSSDATRRVFCKNNVLHLFLELLEEERWHKVVLKALATWLEEDIHHVEAKLLGNNTVHRLISILGSYQSRPVNEISAILNPIHRMLVKSDKLSRKTGLAGLAHVVLDMLEGVDAQTCLTLLRTLTRLYGMHPRPREFLNSCPIEQYLDRLASSSNGKGSDRVLIQKEIADLMNAFQMNQIW